MTTVQLYVRSTGSTLSTGCPLGLVPADLVPPPGDYIVMGTKKGRVARREWIPSIAAVMLVIDDLFEDPAAHLNMYSGDVPTSSVATASTSAS